MSRFSLTVLVTSMLLAACSNSTELTPTTIRDVTTTGSGSPASTVEPTTTSTTAPAITTTTVLSTTTTETGSVREPAGILVAGERGIELVVSGVTTTIFDQATSVAADDLMGGVVFQRAVADGGFGAPEDTIIWWLPADAQDPMRLLVPTGEDRLRLVGVEEIDGSPSVVYIRRTDSQDFENAADTLRLYDLDSSEDVEVRTVGGWESGVQQVTYGGEIFAVNWFGEAYSGFDFFDTRGRDVAVIADPYPADAVCFDETIDPGGSPCFANVAISADGERLAYTVPITGDDGIVDRLDLVIVDTIEGTERARVALREEEPFAVSTIDILGDRVLVNPRQSTTSEAATAQEVDLTSGTITSLDIPGVARFAFTLTD